MIAAVKGWHAAFAALLLWIPRSALAADDLTGAARELARRSVALAGNGEPVSASYRNLSSLGSAGLAQARNAFENAIKEAGGRVSDIAPMVEARVTLSENPTQYLLIEEVRKGDDRQVWLAGWRRTESNAVKRPGISLDRRQVWEQDDPILDVGFPNGAMLVLSPSSLTLYARQDTGWAVQRTAPLVPAKPWPRDLRGHLRVNGASFQVFLPGMLCTGAAEPVLTMTCNPSDDPWVLESGSRAILLGNFAAARNYFDGRIVTQTGAHKTVPPFYSAAAFEEQGRVFWLLTTLDGRAQIADGTLDPLGAVTSWGSDIAGVDARCGAATQVLATRPGDATEPDAIQSFGIANRAASPLTAPVIFPGPVTALWTSGGAAAVAVSHDLATNKYVAYILTVVCGS